VQLAVDTHVHIYPFYRVEMALETVLKNLAKYGAQRTKVACLTERYDCDLFAELSNFPRSEVLEKFDLELTSDSLVVRKKSNGDFFHLLPGQQIITAENIEILSLNCGERVGEGQPAVDTVRAVLDAGGVPVAAWAPGKWFFERGKIVASLLDQFSPAELALGDTTLRPIGWTTPHIIRNAMQRGYRILFGSDPLPFNGEENQAGAYFSKVDSAPGSIAEGTCPGSVISQILTLDLDVSAAGARGSLPEVLLRLYRNNRAPKPSREIASPG